MESDLSGLPLPQVEPRLAATLVLVRDSQRGLEVLLTVRPKEMRFMGGAVVFPGGSVSPADGDRRWADATTGLPEEGAAPAVSALREAFEEVGFAIGSGPLASLPRNATPEGFLEACLELGVRLATDQLVPAGRWVTPLGAPVRFDAHFFVVAAPPRWEPVADPREVAEARWATPAQALADLAAGDAAMAPPTVEMLQRLDASGSVSDALAGFTAGRGIGNEKILSMRLSPFVLVILAPNPGMMTGPGTNTYVFGAGPTAIIDPAVDDPDYVEAVLDVAGDVSVILVTHRHSDHVGGARVLAERTGAPVRAFGPVPAGETEVVPAVDNERISVGSVGLTALHTPGHASDHMCFLFEDAASLFAGDNVLGEGTAVIAPPDGNMAEYIATLERLRAMDIDRIFPGHFRPLHGGAAVIDGYLAHRVEREAKILDALGSEPRDLDEIVAAAYSDTPVELHPVARFSALAHLDKLDSEGRAERVDDLWRSKSLFK
jgi:glyoxylase-like metal-dependent hydrolase (beta-lactamase superfamily II)/8-oxo-dGTP pyrophosphatase MutT (NUDIX family)